MSIKLIDDSTLVDIGNAIREKNYSATKYKPSEMSTAIRALEGGESNAVLVGVIDGSITEITIPSEVTEIRNYAFYCHNNLVNIIIPDSVTSIGEYAFYDCNSLTSVAIGNSVASIGYGAFLKCSSLINIEIPISVTSIGPQAFHSCSSLTSIEIPGSVTSIGYSAFYNCSSLTSITIPDSVDGIDDGAFSGCSSLTSIEIPDSVTSIGKSAFEDCSNLTNVIIGSGITTIERYSFYDCTSLVLIDFRRATAVPILANSNAFTNVPSACQVVVPDELYDEWTNTTYWKELSITYIKQSEYENGSATITDLTDTTWVFNDTITSFPSVVTDYAINFISYVNTVPSNEFESLKLMPAGNIYYIQGSYWPIVYNSSGWVDTQSKTISVTGGADATNTDLIAWLQANAERPIVSFIIDGNTYEAYEGMTWEQWVNSAFNTAGFTIKDDMVCNSSNKYLFDHGGIIISDYYILEGEYYFDNL